ncbi:MAG: hypothetical protein ACOYVD_09765 [Bacillota bacterium]
MLAWKIMQIESIYFDPLGVFFLVWLFLEGIIETIIENNLGWEIVIRMIVYLIKG